MYHSNNVQGIRVFVIVILIRSIKHQHLKWRCCKLKSTRIFVLLSSSNIHDRRWSKTWRIYCMLL